MKTQWIERDGNFYLYLNSDASIELFKISVCYLTAMGWHYTINNISSIRNFPSADEAKKNALIYLKSVLLSTLQKIDQL